MIPEINRMLENWARYQRDGGGPGTSIPWARLITDCDVWNPNRSARIPVDLLEAGRTDQYVQALEPVLRQVVEEYYLWGNTFTEKARRCGCAVRTFYDRIDRAHKVIVRMRGDYERNGLVPQAWAIAAVDQ